MSHVHEGDAVLLAGGADDGRELAQDAVGQAGKKVVLDLCR
jgi:hypothetical protein